MMSNSPLILEIKGNSLDDGPGIRTVVFFKGCPLSCIWCHNPESKSQKIEISFDAKACIGCNTCLGICRKDALSRDNVGFINRDKCDLCFDCVEPCPAETLSIVEEEAKTLPPQTRALKDGGGLIKAEDAAKAIVKAITGKKFTVIRGIKTKISYLMLRFLPERLVHATIDAIVRKASV